MIHIDLPAPPKFYDSDRFTEIEGRLEKYFGDFSRKKRKAGYQWREMAALNREVGPILMEAFQGKCGFCESQIMEVKGVPPTVEHYRPRGGARGLRAEGEQSDDVYLETHYWWLALEWDNLRFTCPQCARFKGTWFPLEDESRRAVIGTRGIELDSEAPLLLDPCDQPEGHLRFDEKGRVEPRSDRGRFTIETLHLNRRELIRGRVNSFQRCLDTINEMVALQEKGYSGIHEQELWYGGMDLLGQELVDVLRNDSPAPFAGIQRQFLYEWLETQPEIDEFLAGMWDKSGARAGQRKSAEPLEEAGPMPEPGAPRLTGVAQRLDLERIELKNFKNIADLKIEIPQTTHEGKAPWLLFLGENAVGKSSILQAIVLTLMGKDRVEVTGMTPDRVLRYYKKDGVLHTCDEGHVRIWLIGRDEPLDLRFKRDDPVFYGNADEPGTYLMAYGSTRLLFEPNQHSEESPGRVRVTNLFKPSEPLIDVTRWLYGLYEENEEAIKAEEDNEFDRVVRGLRQMLLMRDDDDIKPDQDDPDKSRILVDLKGETTTIHRLSDGYSTILTLASDMMYMLSRQGTSMHEADGVVVIDEIGTNLHPGWKKRIVSCFRDVFPRIQFIVTSHEPLCLRGLHEGETVLLRRDYENQIAAITNLPNPSDLRVDELLASEFFGLSSTLESDLEEIYDEYYKLLTVPRANATQKKRMGALKEQLREREHLGHGLRDELMYEVIDKLLAEQLRSPEPRTRTELKKETLEMVLLAWKESGLYDEYLPREEA